MTKHERMQKARQALMGLEAAVVDLLAEYEAGGEKGMQPSKIAQELDLMLPEKGATYGSESHRYSIVWGVLDQLCAKEVIYHAKDGARLVE